MTGTRLLAIKIGNSNVGWGLFDGAMLTHTWRAETRSEKTADEYAALLLTYLEEAEIAIGSIGATALVSVVPELTETMRELCRKYLQREPFIAVAGARSGIGVKYDDPRALGADRLVALVAARAKYGAPCIVIDLGTATTFNALDTSGNFVGGAIAPGVNMSAEALHQFTAKLPRVEIAAPERALATNTRDAVRSGIFFGYVGLIQGMTARLIQEMNVPKVRVIATGGMAKVLAPHCPSVDTIDAELGLDGLRRMWELNVGISTEGQG